MTKPDGNPPAAKNDDSHAWGTWEELLLAFAVNRHGTSAWDSIASELQKRTSDPNLSLTAQNCRLKYLDLKRRFITKNEDSGDVVGDGKSNDEESVPLLEELRTLRVAELRREVQRYDLNIESLELKMKRMEEERDTSSGKEKSESDLENKGEEKRGIGPDTGGEPVPGDESEKDQISANGSNSTDLAAEKIRTGDKGSEPAGTGGEEVRQDETALSSEEPKRLKTEPARKQNREESCNGSSNSIEESDRAAKAEPANGSVELVESEAESEGGRGEEATKENSDVQSSASRSRKDEARNDKVRHGHTSGDEREHEDQSRGIKNLSTESQPLADFLQAIRTHKLGSTFERRLRSQESSKYQKLVLQHIDLETIETRLKQGWYSDSTSKFFRDLLLLVNNALVFFNKSSSEANAAVEVRKLILKEMSRKYSKSDSSSGKQVSLQSLAMKKEEAEPSQSLLLKPRLSGSLIVCRKRSSIAAKASGTSSGGGDKKKEQIPLRAEEKDKKLQTPQPSGDSDEPKITKKRTRDRFPSSSASSKKNGKNTSTSNANKTPVVVESGKNQGKGGSSSQHTETKTDNKKNQSTLDSKKRGAVNFLNRMKQGSSSNNGLLLDALKNTPLTSESSSGKGGSGTKKNDNAKHGEKKVQVTRRSSESRQAKEKGSPSKKNVGRPPRRGAPPSPAPSLGKRGREKGEPESSGSKQQVKKRSRKS